MISNRHTLAELVGASSRTDRGIWSRSGTHQSTARHSKRGIRTIVRNWMEVLEYISSRGQIWAGKSSLRMLGYANTSAAGTELYNNIGWSWKAWKLWISDRELYKALPHGITTLHAHRVFETGKKTA
jgi:hypothetical protein